jgi:hypothetical protein
MEDVSRRLESESVLHHHILAFRPCIVWRPLGVVKPNLKDKIECS